ncbi:hypothetical protein [Sorangium sp. So ce131]|uniref:hypothetical protein n=1 Tax=Sorangium sp. So ce131 TaxID=3133282 RepID=UPI003F612B26
MFSHLYKATGLIAVALTGIVPATLAGCMAEAGPSTDLEPDALEEEISHAGDPAAQAVALGTPVEASDGPGELPGEDTSAANRSVAVCDATLAVCRAANQAAFRACRLDCERRFCNPTTGVCYVDVSVCYAECERPQRARDAVCLANYLSCLVS